MEAQPPSAYMHAVHDALRSQAWALSGLGPRTLNLGITLFCRALFTLHSPSRDAATRCTVGLSWQDPMPAPSNKHALTQTLEHQRRQQEGAEVAAAGKRHAPDPGPESRRGPRLRPRSPPWQTWQKVTSSADSLRGDGEVKASRLLTLGERSDRYETRPCVRSYVRWRTHEPSASLPSRGREDGRARRPS